MKRSIATLACLALIAVAFDCGDCHGQLFRGRFRSNHAANVYVSPEIRWAQPTASAGLAVNRPDSPQPVFPRESYYPDQRNPVISRMLDGKLTHRYRDPHEVDSRYIGGFHQNLFQNLGLPSGDIGLRGNALNWRTW